MCKGNTLCVCVREKKATDKKIEEGQCLQYIEMKRESKTKTGVFPFCTQEERKFVVEKRAHKQGKDF